MRCLTARDNALNILYPLFFKEIAFSVDEMVKITVDSRYCKPLPIWRTISLSLYYSNKNLINPFYYIMDLLYSELSVFANHIRLSIIRFSP